MKRNRCTVGIYRGTPKAIFKQIIREFPIEKVIANHDYERYAIERDEEIRTLLKADGIDFATYKDQVIYDKKEVVKDDGKPYVVYTPYSRKWRAKFEKEGIKNYPSEDHLDNLYTDKPLPQISLNEMGFEFQMVPKILI